MLEPRVGMLVCWRSLPGLAGTANFIVDFYYKPLSSIFSSKDELNQSKTQIEYDKGGMVMEIKIKWK